MLRQLCRTDGEIVANHPREVVGAGGHSSQGTGASSVSEVHKRL